MLSLDKKTGSGFKNLKQRIRWQGASDYDMRKAITFMENYKRTMEKYSSFKNYDKLKEKMDSVSNPLAFYNLVKDKELIRDLTYQSTQMYTEVEFNNFVEDWGIEVTEDIMTD